MSDRIIELLEIRINKTLSRLDTMSEGIAEISKHVSSPDNLRNVSTRNLRAVRMRLYSFQNATADLEREHSEVKQASDALGGFSFVDDKLDGAQRVIDRNKRLVQNILKHINEELDLRSRS